MKSLPKRVWSTFWMILLLGALPMLAQGQAGSADPLTLDSPAAFYQTLSLFGPAGSGGSPPPMRPRGILKLPGEEQHLLWVDMAEGMLHLLQQQQDGGLISRRIIPVSIGKNGAGKEVEGDKRTPVGVYRITSFLDDRDLIDFYGEGAYPLNYPNASDRRRRRTGSGIWLHGLPKGVDERPFLDSDGCVVIDNDSLRDLAQVIDTGATHVVLSDQPMQWQPVSVGAQRRQSLEQAFQGWRLAWEEIDNDAYLAYYAEDFSDFNRNLSQWSVYKRRVNNSKTSIEVGVSDLSFFADPRYPEQVTVRYYQRYRSSNYRWDGWKEQLWRQTDEGWRILYEGNG